MTNMIRRMWRYPWFIVLALCGLSGVWAPVFAQPPGPPPPHEGRLQKLIEAVGLDEKTRTEVDKILDASKAERQELRGKLREAHGRMRSLLEQEKPDEAAVMAQADVIGVLETEAQKQRLRTILQVRTLLTPEQRAKLLELLRARGPRGPRRFRESCSREDRQPDSPGDPLTQ